ncbi:MAG TPA: ABC transporter permease [Bryobacteraceae bacterium]|jgi:predicted permease
MRTLREWMRRLWGTIQRNSRDREIEEELRAHLEMAVDQMQARGGSAPISQDAARRAATLEQGGIAQAQESMRDQRGFPWMADLISDTRYALRMLQRSPGFAGLAIAIMALGIGANTAVFSVVNAVLLRPLAYRDPDRIVTLTNPLAAGEDSSPLAAKLVSIPNFQDWRDRSSSFEAMAFYYPWENPVMAGPTAEYARVTKVSRDFFRVFAVEPILGRLFNADEAKPGGNGAVLIGYAYWQSHFGGDPHVLGRTIRRYSAPQSIVGVLPPSFRFPDATEIWVPDTDNGPGTRDRDAQNHYIVGRLKPGVPLEKAQAEMALIGRRLAQEYPDTNKNRTVAVTSIRDELVGDIRLTLYLLLGAVGLVLLIACANTATLLLGRATARTREVAVRAALGAGRRRIARQLLTESLLLALLASVAGLLLAYWGSKALIALAPSGVPRLGETGVDRWVLAFTLGASVVTSLMSGLAPALYASKVDINDALKQAAARSVIGGGIARVRAPLVVVEIALAVVLVSSAGLLVKSLVALQKVELGFRPQNVLVMRATGPGSIRDTNLFFKDVLSRIAAVPGVVATGATMALPGHVGSSGIYYFDHLPERPDLNGPTAVNSVITPGVFAALGIPLKSGRDFNDGDILGNPFVAIVNEALIRRSLPGENPIGRTIFCPFDSHRPMTIVGVVGDVRELGPARGPIPECYMPNRQHVYNNGSLSVVTRTTGDPAAIEGTLRRFAHDRAPDIPVTFTTLEEDASGNVAAPRFRTLLLALFAALAICLATAGVYGVMAYSVGQRSNEIGLRIALGASPGSVLRQVLRQGLVLASVGLIFGLAGAAVVTRVLGSMLFEVKASDPSTYLAVAVLLGAVTLLASFVPARRASRIDPLEALRQE